MIIKKAVGFGITEDKQVETFLHFFGESRDIKSKYHRHLIIEGVIMFFRELVT